MAWQHHASTAAQGDAYGVAAVLQALANKELQDAQAAILWEQARELAMKNRLTQTETLQQLRYLQDRYKEQERELKRLRNEQGKKLMAKREQEVLVPAYALDFDQFDPASGQIKWPQTLSDGKDVEKIDRFMQQLAKTGPHKDGLYLEAIGTLVDRWQDDLRLGVEARSENEMVDWQDYFEQQKFLRGVRYAAESFNSPKPKASANAVNRRLSPQS
ncbi:hypothetical protein Mal64_31750 [Pseudobythopirellula maris]|uniref:Uncharacterized protein n=2 Tax=Pseudobythopirellula maris TaxID=2527991 RepID=A0A5C5ZMG6_9BACT|nr:hypothetical protein Mal64_31750 [Pseudobythopirellula maris]